MHSINSTTLFMPSLGGSAAALQESGGKKTNVGLMSGRTVKAIDEMAINLQGQCERQRNAERKIARIIIENMKEEEVQELWKANKTVWPVISNQRKFRNFSSISFYWPTNLLKSAVDMALSKNISGLELSYKHFFDRFMQEEPTTEIIIGGGLVRDLIYNIANEKEVKPVDVDVQITLKNEKSETRYQHSGKAIQQIVRAVLTEYYQIRFGRASENGESEAFVAKHMFESATGYIGVGDREKGLDIFDANTFLLDPQYRCDFTCNTVSYRYSEDAPFLLSKSKVAIVDTINRQLRLSYNPFDTLEACLDNPGQICRYLYFRAIKGFRRPEDRGLTNYALQLAIDELIRRSTSDNPELGEQKKGGQYASRIHAIEAGMRLSPGTKVYGDVTFEKDLSRAVDKFFTKKFSDPEHVMGALTVLKDDFSAYSREFLLLAELVRVVLKDVDKDGVFEAESSRVIEEIKREVKRRESMAKKDVHIEHEVPLSDIFHLMKEIFNALPCDESQQLKSDLNHLIVDMAAGFDYKGLKEILANLLADAKHLPLKPKIQYLQLCFDTLIDDSCPRIGRYEAESQV